MSKTRLGIRIGAALVLTALGSQGALAADLQISGSITQEMGIKITGKRNQYNAAGNPYNGVAEPYAGLGSAGAGSGFSGASGSQSGH